MLKKIKYKLSIQPLTALHIGSGESLYRTDFVIKNGRCLVLNMDKLLVSVASNDKYFDEYKKVCSSSIAELQLFLLKYLNSLSNADEFVLYSTTCSKGIIDSINDSKTKFSNFSINQAYHVPIKGTIRTVVPGSSVKGALRTAILNGLTLDSEKLSDNDWHSLKNKKENAVAVKDYKGLNKMEKEYQGKLLTGKYNNIDDFSRMSSFRCIELTDFIFPKRNENFLCCSGMLDNFSKSKTGNLTQKNMKIAAEMIQGYYLTGNENIEANGQIIFNEGLADQINVPYRFDVQTLIKYCNKFSSSEFGKEYEKFYSGNDSRFNVIKKLKEKFNNIGNDDKFLLRIGRWSQNEFVTPSEQLRYPTTKKGFGKSRTLYVDDDGNLIPLGWCLCSISKLSIVE